MESLLKLKYQLPYDNILADIFCYNVVHTMKPILIDIVALII